MSNLSPLRRAAWLAAVLLAIVPAANAATPIWRCGKVYTDQPCAGGQSIQTDAAPSAERQRDADESTRRAQASADAMEQSRLHMEAEQSRRGPALIVMQKEPPQETKPAARALKKRKDHRASDDFIAYDPQSVPKKKKAKASKDAG